MVKNNSSIREWVCVRQPHVDGALMVLTCVVRGDILEASFGSASAQYSWTREAHASFETTRPNWAFEETPAT